MHLGRLTQHQLKEAGQLIPKDPTIWRTKQKQNAERLANAELKFAFAQLRAEHTKNDARKAQRFTGITEILKK